MYEVAVQDLIDQFGRLPGIGPKSAQRLAFHILASPTEQVSALAAALLEVKDKVSFCSQCGNIAQAEQCTICLDPRRNQASLCVVEEPKDVIAIERTREYRGLYHVLGGAINPIRGIGPDQLRIRQLFQRLENSQVNEVILATNPNIEGDATATYLARSLSSVGITVSRLALGLPVGGDLEYADEVTLGRAFEGRRPVQ
ncbi:MAG: recombination mediator RecR [Bifidobacteriaceae bacterium]|nr:recombination mediator RecR [Bifidobacteriaceae bacterium]